MLRYLRIPYDLFFGGTAYALLNFIIHSYSSRATCRLRIRNS